MSQSVMKFVGVVLVAVACAPRESTSTAEPSASVGASWAECPKFDPESAVKAHVAKDLSCPDAVIKQQLSLAGSCCRDPGACPDWIAHGCGLYAEYAVDYTFEYHANCATGIRLLGPPRDATRMRFR